MPLIPVILLKKKMPELPEVNTFQRYFDQTSLQQKIEAVEVQDDKIIQEIDGDAFSQKMTGRIFTSSYRRGKYLFGQIDNGHHLLLHFGMTGDLKYYSDPLDQPRHERFALHFDNGFRLGFDCPRKFAKIRYIENLEDYLTKIGLGEDALVIDESTFLKRSEGKKGSIKGFLLNQKNLAGVGNLYADEICYQTRVHPASTTGAVPPKKRKAIFQKMQEVLRFAIDKNAYYKEYPEDWLWQWRKDGARSPDGKHKIQHAKIAGRTTYFFEGWQKRY